MDNRADSRFQILLIDDDRILQRILQKTLQEQGYDVSLASSGEAGLELVKHTHPQLIICDWLMEGMDGLEVCQRIKTDPDLDHPFFILLTSRSAVEDRVQGLNTGADDFLSKPIDPSELIARVRAGLRLYQSNQELKQLAQDLQLQKQRLEAELTEAADYVRSLLPAPMRGEITINTCFLPSRQLGGDCFDFYWLDQDHLVVYLLDVSGHGLAAALPSISVHNLLRSRSLPTASLYDPEQVLSDLNSIFQMDRQNERYFTIWYGVYNRLTQQLSYASAGHPPALLLTDPTQSANPIQPLTTRGMAIGLFPEIRFKTSSLKVDLPARLYIFSDGIYEVEKANGSLWNLPGFMNFLQDYDRQFELDLDGILQQIQFLTGSQTFQDDCSIIQIQFG
uniref:Response regulator receiver modulated serine phosphatase n=1 Tax=Cyanothece sp. (strain PCC 7425 / ATCC 29141) TaxID=395961 RepID=B8HJR9_CYAP4